MPPSGRGHIPQSRTATVACGRYESRLHIVNERTALHTRAWTHSARAVAQTTLAFMRSLRRAIPSLLAVYRYEFLMSRVGRARFPSVSLARVVSDVSILPAIAILTALSLAASLAPHSPPLRVDAACSPP